MVGVSLEQEHEPIVERIIHGMVRKHIAGTTMDSALEAAKQLNSKNIPASLMFISSNVTDKAKAKYITTTYSELIRRIARSGLKAGVQVPLEQLGAGIDSETAMDNFSEIVAVGNKYGVFLWAEPDGMKSSVTSSIARMKGVGIAINEDDAGNYKKYGRKLSSVKLVFRKPISDGKEGAMKRLESLRKSFPRLVVARLPEKDISKVLKNKQKMDISIEFEFGYSEKKIAMLAKKGVKVSVLVPFGKDWIKYAMNNAPESYMRFVARKLLKDGGENYA